MAQYKVAAYITYKWLLSGSEPSQADLNKFALLLSQAVNGQVKTIRASCGGGTIFGAFPTPFTPKTCVIQLSLTSPIEDSREIETIVSDLIQKEQRILGLIPGQFFVETRVSAERISGIDVITSAPEVAYFVLGVSSGLTIGIIIFGLLKLIRG